MEKNERILILEKRRAYFFKLKKQAKTRVARRRYTAEIAYIDAVIEELEAL